MKLNRPIVKLTMAGILIVSLSMLQLQSPRHPARQYLSGNLQGLLQLARQTVTINQASAGILDEAGGEMANTIRFLYMLINGPGDNGYPTGMDGPDGGFLGMIREITGPTALGGGLANGGYTNCTDLPSTGETSMTDMGGTFRMVFGTPTKTVPSGYTGAGSTFEKRVTVQFDGTTFMNIEFNCNTNVGWLRFNEPGQSTSRNIEVYWDTESSTASKLELYMFYETGLDTAYGNEYFVAKFATEADNKYKFWIVRSVDKTGTSNDEGFRAAAYGDATNNVVNAYIKWVQNITDTTTDHNDNGLISSGDVECLDVSNPLSITSSTACGSLTLDATAGSPIIDSGDGFSISWAADTTNGLKADMSAIVDP